jgi:hypothetical protein
MMTESSFPLLRSSRIAFGPARTMPDGCSRHDLLPCLEIRTRAAISPIVMPGHLASDFDHIFPYPQSIRFCWQDRSDPANASPTRPTLFESFHHE